jgi:HD superfamily phosphohydrolase
MDFDISFPDPLYGRIRATKFERYIIDLPEFQRLKRIKQLGVAHVIFPGAIHTRFEHCMGTMHVADLIFQRFEHKFDKKFDFYRQQLRLAGLLHDIGHSPFSHTFEIALSRMDNTVGFQYKKHEFNTKAIISNFGRRKDIAKLIKKLKISTKPLEYFKKIGKISTGDSRGLNRDERFLASIISSDIDADRLDYLLRDSLHTGINFIGFNLNQLLESISIHPKKYRLLIGKAGEYKTFHERSAIAIGEAILISRYHHYLYLVNHRKNISANLMFVKAFINSVDNFRKKDYKNKKYELNDFFKKKDDCNFIRFIEEYGDNEAIQIIDNYKKGKLFHIALDLKYMAISPSIRLAIEFIKRNQPILNDIENEIRNTLDYNIHLCISYIKGVPKNLRIRFFDEDSFLYDESKLASGLIKELLGSNSLYFLCEQKKDIDHCNKLIRKSWDKIISIITNKINKERSSKPFELDFLIIFFDEFNKHIINKNKNNSPIDPSQYLIKYITRIYKMIKWIQNKYPYSCKGCPNPLNYSFNKDYGYTYSPDLFEDIMKLASMGFIKVIIYEKKRPLIEQGIPTSGYLDYIDNRFHNIYKFHILDDGKIYAKTLENKYKKYIDFINNNIDILYKDIYIDNIEV